MDPPAFASVIVALRQWMGYARAVPGTRDKRWSLTLEAPDAECLAQMLKKLRDEYNFTAARDVVSFDDKGATLRLLGIDIKIGLQS